MNILFGIAAVYLLAVNIVTYFVYRADKIRARRHEWRISEFTLLFLAFIGGGIGAALAMYFLRHKTKHLQFVILVPLFMVLQILAMFWFVLNAGGVL